MFATKAEGTSPPKDDIVLHPKQICAQTGKNQHLSKRRDMASSEDSPWTCDWEGNRPKPKLKTGGRWWGPLANSTDMPATAWMMTRAPPVKPRTRLRPELSTHILPGGRAGNFFSRRKQKALKLKRRGFAPTMVGLRTVRRIHIILTLTSSLSH